MQHKNIIKNRKYIQILGSFTEIEQKVYALLLHHLRVNLLDLKVKKQPVLIENYTLVMPLKDITKYSNDRGEINPIIKKQTIIKGLEKLFNTSIKINIIREDSKITKYVHLFKDMQIIDDKIVKIQFPNEITKSIIEYKDFANINLDIFLKLKGKHALRLYENLVAYYNPKNPNIHLPQMDINTFKNLIGLDETAYPEYKFLKQNIINPILNELNKNSDLHITLTEIKESRRVSSLKFKAYKDKRTANETPSNKSPIEINKMQDYKLIILLSDEFSTFIDKYLPLYQDKVFKDAYNVAYKYKDTKLFIVAGDMEIEVNKTQIQDVLVNLYLQQEQEGLFTSSDFKYMLRSYKQEQKSLETFENMQ